jgi:hypothetical protein
MKDIFTLLMPRMCSFKGKRFSKNNRGGLFKLLLLGTTGILFWAGIFAVSLRVLIYFREIAELGDILACKLLSMVLLTFFFPSCFQQHPDLTLQAVPEQRPVSCTLHAGSRVQDFYCKVDRKHCRQFVDGHCIYAPDIYFIRHRLSDRSPFLYKYCNDIVIPFDDCIRYKCPYGYNCCEFFSGKPYKKHVCIHRPLLFSVTLFCV